MRPTIHREVTSRLPITPKHNINAAYQLAHYLGNNISEKTVCVVLHMYFSPDTFSSQRVEFTDRKPTDRKRQVFMKVF